MATSEVNYRKLVAYWNMQFNKPYKGIPIQFDWTSKTLNPLKYSVDTPFGTDKVPRV